MLIDITTAREQLLTHDNILILAHQKPDGDTLGASFALMWALMGLGKKARVECVDGFSARYAFLYGEYEPDMSFAPEYVVATDVASVELLGAIAEKYADNVDLCIDHHKSNSLYAKHTLLDPDSPAACQIMYEVISSLGAVIDKRIANAIFTGLATDTGCFKYASVTAKTHFAAAKMIECGAEHAKINKMMFDCKSRGMLMVDSLMVENTTFYLDDRCAVSVVPFDIHEKYGVSDEDLDGVSAFPIRIEGVLAGITIRVKQDNTYRVSARTVSPVDASKICSGFGGGGHMNAAGCTMSGDLYETINRILSAVNDEFKCHESA